MTDEGSEHVLRKIMHTKPIFFVRLSKTVKSVYIWKAGLIVTSTRTSHACVNSSTNFFGVRFARFVLICTTLMVRKLIKFIYSIYVCQVNNHFRNVFEEIRKPSRCRFVLVRDVRRRVARALCDGVTRQSSPERYGFSSTTTDFHFIFIRFAVCKL